MRTEKGSSFCQKLCIDSGLGCYYSAEIITQSETGGKNPDGSVTGLPEVSMRRYLNDLVTTGIYAVCKDKEKLRHTMEQVVPGSTKDIDSNPESTTR